MEIHPDLIGSFFEKVGDESYQANDMAKLVGLVFIELGIAEAETSRQRLQFTGDAVDSQRAREQAKYYKQAGAYLRFHRTRIKGSIPAARLIESFRKALETTGAMKPHELPADTHPQPDSSGGAGSRPNRKASKHRNPKKVRNGDGKGDGPKA